MLRSFNEQLAEENRRWALAQVEKGTPMKYSNTGKQVLMTDADGGNYHVADASTVSVASAIAEALNLRVGETYRGTDAADAPDAAAPTESGTLLDDATRIIRMAYMSHTGSALKASKTAEKVLEAVMKHYEALAEK
jgi:hypothetical protein